jgi:curved DNA-binding protein CbpA
VPVDHYQVLGVAPSATPDQIRRAYRALAKQHHPDVSDSKDAAKRFAAIAAAYEVLSNPDKRREHDRKLAARRAAPAQTASDLRQGHYAWVNVAAPRTAETADISEIDELYDTFFQRVQRVKSTPPQQPPNGPSKKARRRPRPKG